MATPRKLNVTPQPRVNPDAYPAELWDALNAHPGTDDAVYAPSLPPRQQKALGRLGRRRFGSDLWVPEGFHAGIHWEHAALESAGPYAFTRRMAHCWHETVSAPDTVDAMWSVLRDKRAAPHFVLGFRHGLVRPVAIQCIPLDQAARALAHPSGPETNRAGVLVQTEVCSRPTDILKWGDWHMYKAFANFIRVINETMAGTIPWDVARSFENRERFGGDEFTCVSGHLGHMHVPVNDHTDPFGMDGDHLEYRLQNLAVGDYWDLSGVGPDVTQKKRKPR